MTKSTHGSMRQIVSDLCRKVLDDSHRVFEQLLTAIEGLSDQVYMDVPRYLPWLGENPFAPATVFAHFHDEHEPDMRAWLAQIKK